MSESTPPTPPAEAPDAEAFPSDPTADSSSPPETVSKPDDLPEEYELTPELVEEEAIRGDVFLRWMAILLAVMLGCTHIADSEALVHVKAGQYLASHGVIPDGTDPFAYTTEGRVWRNQSWLFDLILAGVYGVGGALGLSSFKALITGVVIWCVSSISRPRTPTWWNSIIAVLSVIALTPFLTATPEIVTILGFAVLLRLLSDWRFQQTPALNWKLGVLFLLWCNSDPQMYLGLLLLVLLGIGEWLRSTPREDAPIIPSQVLWSTVGIVCLATLINPFGWNSWLSAWQVHGVLDPAMRTYFAESSQFENLGSFPIWSAPFWNQLTIPFVSALVLAGLALSSIYLNFGKWIAGDVLAVLVFGALAACTLREFGPAIVVMCVVTSLYCQDWYRESFSQEYTVNQGELLFSRGGRALTIVAFLAVAWLGMSGRLYNHYLTSMGFGFEDNLKVSVDGLKTNLADSFDNRPFNFTTRQGDTLIWADQQVFIDSRLALFTGKAESLEDIAHTDLIALHSATRNALRYSDDPDQYSENRRQWKSTFDRFQITHGLPRIAGQNPDYLTYTLLLLNPEFRITVLAPSVAIFYRNDLQSDDYREYLASHRLNFIDQAFGKEVAIDKSIKRDFFPQPNSGYVSYLTADREQTPSSLLLAQHYSQHIEQAAMGSYQIDFRTQLAFCYLGIRNANLALAENANNSEAFRLLGFVYYYLSRIEQNFCDQFGTPYDPTLRLMQAQLAFQQTLIVKSDDLQSADLLYQIAQARRQPESILRAARRFVELLLKPDTKLQNQQDMIEQLQKVIDDIDSQLIPIFDQVDSQLAEGADPLQMAGQLNSLGFPYKALEIMEKYSGSITKSTESELILGILYLETGKAENAYTTLLKLEPYFSQYALIDGFRYAAYSALGHGDYPSAYDLLLSETEIYQSLRAAQILLPTMPLAIDPEIYTASRYESWTRWINQVEEESVRKLWVQAIILLEEGENAKSAKVLERALELYPNTTFRPMLLAYHSCVSKEEIDPIRPDDRIPVTAELFAEDPQGTE